MKYLRTFLIFAVLLSVMNILAHKSVVYWFPAPDGNPTPPDGLAGLIVPFGLLSTFIGFALQCPVVFLLRNGLGLHLSSMPYNGIPLVVPLSAGMYTGLHLLIGSKRKEKNSRTTDSTVPSEGAPSDVQ